jgi:hypothetical protein
MFLLKNAFATVWTVEPKEKFTQARISTSEKEKDTDKYVNSNWTARFVGKAKDAAATLKEKDRITIVSGKVTNTMYEKDGEKKSFLQVVIFDFTVNGSNGNSTSSTVVESDELPF